MKGDLKGAVQDYTYAIQLNSKFATAYNNRGISREKLKEFDLAISDYSKRDKPKSNKTGCTSTRLKHTSFHATGCVSNAARGVSSPHGADLWCFPFEEVDGVPSCGAPVPT